MRRAYVPLMFFSPNLTLTEKFAELITGLCGALSKQSNARCFTAGPLRLLAWQRWSRMRRLFTAVVARMHAGTLPAKAPPRPLQAKPRPAAKPDQPRLPPLRSGWVVRLCPEYWHLNGWRVPLAELLADPEMLAAVQAAPQMGRILRPLCHMLHFEMPAYLRLPPRPRRPRPPRPKRPLTPEQVDAKVARMSRMAYANMINPNDPDPSGIRPPNRIGYGRPKPFPRPG